MWKTKVASLEGESAQKFSIFAGETQLCFRQVIAGWKDSDVFRNFYSSLLVSSPYPAAFWETPPLTRAELDAPYEFVLVKSDTLAGVQSDKSTFQEKFSSAADGAFIVSFDNLGGDSRLISPVPNREGASNFAHLLSFLRSATEAQSNEFWATIAREFEVALGEETKWLSTSGLGIYWTHARIDPRPKYYTFSPYRSASYRTSAW